MRGNNDSRFEWAAIAFIIVVIAIILLKDDLVVFCGLAALGFLLYKVFTGDGGGARDRFRETPPGAAPPYPVVMGAARRAIPAELYSLGPHGSCRRHGRRGCDCDCYKGAVPDPEGGKGLYRGGLVDREIYDILPEGNPFNTSRTAAPPAADPCVDDEANDGEMDCDERVTYQARSRNDDSRVVAGSMNLRREMDKYLREEVEEEENSQWWGRQEI